MADAEYIKGAELPDVAMTWNDPVSGIIDFTSGWTFSLRIGAVGQTALLEKTSGFTPGAAPPNLVIAWAAGELDSLPPGVHTVDVEARNTGSNKDRKRRFEIEIIAEVLDAP